MRSFECLVTLLVVLLLMAQVLKSTEALQIEAERLSMQGVVRSLEAAALLSSILDSELPAPGPGGNPMALLEEEPANYLGELDGPDPAAIAGGHWYFDSRQRTLLYRVRHAECFQTPLSVPVRARFRLVPAGTGRAGVAVVALEPYRWRNGSNR